MIPHEVRQAILKDAETKLKGMSPGEKLKGVASAAMAIAVRETIDNEDRSLQRDILDHARKLDKAAGLLFVAGKIADMMYENKDNHEEAVSEVAQFCIAMLDVSKDQSEKSSKILGNLLEQYKKDHPNVVEAIDTKVMAAFKAGKTTDMDF